MAENLIYQFNLIQPIRVIKTGVNFIKKKKNKKSHIWKIIICEIFAMIPNADCKNYINFERVHQFRTCLLLAPTNNDMIEKVSVRLSSRACSHIASLPE